MAGTAPARRAGPRRALTHDQIVAAALRLLDESGPAAASVRGIATALGVAPNAVYTYFPDKAAVVAAVVEHLLGEVHAAARFDPDTAWRDGVTTLAVELRRVLLEHPGAVPLMLGGPMDGPHALALNERLLQLLALAGLPPDDAARAAYLLIVHAFGSIAMDVADASATAPLPPETERVAARLAGFAAVPAATLPRTAAVAPVMAAYVTLDQYLWGLDRVLDGLVAAR